MTNIFHTTYTISKMMCKLIINNISCENVVYEEANPKLILKTDHHPKLYKLSWLKKGNDITINRQCMVSFFIS